MPTALWNFTASLSLTISRCQPVTQYRVVRIPRKDQPYSCNTELLNNARIVFGTVLRAFFSPAMRFITNTQPNPPSTHSTGPKVLAAGLWRCATSSLQCAFESHLNLSPSLHGATIMPSIPLLKLCCAACREPDTAKRRAILHRLFDGYNASSDFPGMAFVDDLMDIYPEMQIVLNKRESAEAWERSVRSSLMFFSTRKYALCTWWVGQSYWHHQLYRAYMDLAWRRFGIRDVFTEEFYRRHNEWVRQVARPHGKEVVEWEPRMGWGPLCELVGMEEPMEQFPNENEGRAIRELTRFLIVRGLKAWAVVLLTPAILGLAMYLAMTTSL